MDQSLVQALLHPSVYLTINVTLFICAVLVLMMQPGFMLLEAGSVSRKNAINNVFKNFLDLCVCGLFFWWIGYDILAGQSYLTGFLGMIGLTKEPAEEAARILPTEPVAIFFQLVFASTAVTITSGCVTGRIRPFHYIVYSIGFSTIIYPVIAFLVWHPEGILYGVFKDFAGSAVVHGVGGFAGLAGMLLLGPRMGFFRHGADVYGADVVDGLADSHQPHNLPLASLGVFLLWIGWFGFNAGTHFSSGVEEFTELDTSNILAGLQSLFDTFGVIIANTILAPSAGALAVTVLLLARNDELDMLSILNGALAGLVGITGSADVAGQLATVAIGAICGITFVFVVDFMDGFRIDDPVGAFPVHGVCGFIGIVAAGFFPGEGQSIVASVFTQIGIGALLLGFAFAAAAGVFMLSVQFLKLGAMIGIVKDLTPGYGDNLLRVSPDVELEGLDLHLHGRDAYNIYDQDRA